MAVIIGSARIDEHGHISGGAVGDQTGREVSTQTFYVHSKGWYVIRAKSSEHANKIAQNMKDACANNNIGYDQSNRLGVITYGIHTKKRTECDCSSLVRACVMEATGKDPGNFTTSDEVQRLEATGLFEPKKAYTSGMMLYTGDILVTKTKGHTVIVTSGVSRSAKKTYTGDFPTLPPRGYYVIGDGYKQLTGYKTHIKRVQNFLNWAISAKLNIDGEYGTLTEAAVKKFQKTVFITADGKFGAETLKKAKTFSK